MASNKRVPHVDADLARRVSDRLLPATKSLEDQIKREPRRQLLHSMAAGNIYILAAFSYALGEPLTQVASWLRRAAESSLKVFELRSESENFPSELVTITVDASSGEAVDVERQWRTDRDYSLTNSRSGVDAIYMALSSAQPLIAQRLGQLIWDPPDSPYIHPESEVCTPDDQRVAYAVKQFLMGNRDEAAVELDGISGRDARTAVEGRLLRALLHRDRSAFVEALTGLLKWHATEAKKPRNKKDSSYFLNLAALGLTALALRDGVVTADDLPSDTPHYPVDLLLAGSE